MRVQRAKTVMGAFSHESRKPTTLLPCHDWHTVLERHLPFSFAQKKFLRHRRYCQESQAYTQEYARAVFEAHREWLKRHDVEFLSEDCEGATYVEAKIPHSRFEDVEDSFGVSSTKLFWDA